MNLFIRSFKLFHALTSSDGELWPNAEWMSPAGAISKKTWMEEEARTLLTMAIPQERRHLCPFCATSCKAGQSTAVQLLRTER